MFKVNNKDTWRHSGVFIVNFGLTSHLVLVFLLLTLSKQMPADKVSNADLSTCQKYI